VLPLLAKTYSDQEALKRALCLLTIVLHVSVGCWEVFPFLYHFFDFDVIDLIISYFSGCAEFFGIRNGEEYFVSYYLLEK